MKNLKRTQNKLLRSGFISQNQNGSYEYWIDVTHNGKAISFQVDDTRVKGRFKIHGARPDEPQHDLWYSSSSAFLKEAIELARM